MDKKESFYWDIVKGTAIFLMIWGHCIQYCALKDISYMEDLVFKTIYSFHMPIFMLVSGYLFYYSFRKRTMVELLEHRMRGMLQPIVMGTFLNNVLLLLPGLILSNSLFFLYGALFQGIGEFLWFLWTVLYSSLIVGFCCKVTEKLHLQVLLLILGVFVILMLPQWNETLYMYPYFVAGFFCGRFRKEAGKVYRIARYLALVVFPFMLAFYTKNHYIYVTPVYSEELGLAASMEIAFYRWAIGFVGSICLLAVMEFFLWLGEKAPAVNRCLQGVSCLGRNSLQIYCLSYSLLSGYMKHLYRKAVELMGSNLFAQNQLVYDFLFTPLLAIAWSVLLYYLVMLMRKTRLHRLIFGR